MNCAAIPIGFVASFVVGLLVGSDFLNGLVEEWRERRAVRRAPSAASLLIHQPNVVVVRVHLDHRLKIWTPGQLVYLDTYHGHVVSLPPRET